MRKTLTWIGIGAIALIAYTYGARAGRGRYREIRAAAEALWNDPRIKRARAKALDEADRAARSAVKHAKRIGR